MRTYLAIGCAVVVLGGGAAYFTLGSGQEATESLSTMEHDAAEHAAGLWTCEMHPEIVRREAGVCPICNMKLVAVAPSDAAASPAPEGGADARPPARQ